MSLDPVTAGLQAVSSLKLGNLLGDAFQKDLRELEEDEWRRAREDMEMFARRCLCNDVASCTLLIAGLRNEGPSAPRLTSGELDHLRSLKFYLDGSTLVRLYCLGREGDAAARVLDHTRTEAILGANGGGRS